jgi:TP901 family phage tail tape measure protein
MSQSIQIPVTQVGLEQSIAAAMKRVGNSSRINLGTNSKQINALSQPLGRITGQADEFSKSMAAANARVLAFGASASIIAGVSVAMSGLLSSTIKVEKSLVEINAVLGKSSAELDKFGQDIFNVAKNTGKSFSEVATGALELARQGLSAEDTLARLNDAMILSRLSGLDAAQSVQGLTAAFNSFKSSGISTAEILNKVVAAAQSFAVSEKDIIEGLGRSASVADLAGVSFNELAAIITAIQEKTARGGAVIGNSLKTIFARIQDRAVISDLDDMGITVKNLQGDVLPALKILENLAAELNGFSQIEQADISKKLGGIYQLDKLLAALMDLSSESSVYRKTLEEIGISGDKAYKKNAVLNETLASIINKVAVSAEQLGAKLGEIGLTDNLKNILGFFNSLLEGIQKVLGEESGLGTLVKGLVKGLGNFFAGPGLALFGAIILKLSKDLVQFGFASLKAFFGIGRAAKEIQSVESAISQVLARNVDLQQKLFQLEGNRAGQLKVITGALVEQEALLRKSANISSGLAAPLYNVGVRASDSGLRIKNKAGGYMPAVAKESQAINSGVGGARRGDKPVVMPNFNFGQGKKGTVVAHTGEYVVPNFGGGKGSAIFNRDMVQKMGLPDGARKITASGGLIPNFKDVEITKKVSEFSSLGRLVTAKKVDSIDSFTSSISPIEQTLTSAEYTKKAQKQLKEIVPKFGRNNLQINQAKLDQTLGFFKKAGVDTASIQTFKSAVQNLDAKRPTSGQFLNIQNRMKGILGEIDASEMSGQKLNQGNSFLDLSDGSEVKTVKTQKASEILKKGINQYLLSSNIYDGEDNKTQLGKIPVYLPKGTPLLNSASGFIPNFAPKFNAETVRQYANDIEKYKSPTKDFYEFPDGTGGYGANVRLVLSRSQSKAVSNKQEKEKKISDKGFYNLDADALGGILLVSPRFGKSKGSLDTSMPIGKIPFFNQANTPSIDKNKYIKLKGIKTANTPSGRDLQALQGDISQLFAGGIVDLAYKLYGSTFDPASGGEFANKLKLLDPSKKQQLLPAAAQGDLFEAAGKVALNSFANLESLFGSAEQSRPFDFQNASALQKMFGVNAQRGEAKRGGEKNFSSSDQVSGIVKKVFNDPEYSLTALESLRGQGAFNFSKAQKAASESKAASAANAAGGFIPNFVRKSREIGSGAFGTFFRLGKNKEGSDVGVKKFKSYIPSRSIEAEWLTSEFVNKYANIPSVFGPANLSTFEDSKRKRAIRKAVVSDPLARTAIGSEKASSFGQKVLFAAFKARGLEIGDFHGSNYTLNKSAQDAISGMQSFPSDPVGAFSVLRQIAATGGRIGAIDVGAAHVTDPARGVIGQIMARQASPQAFAKGYLPNFADPLKDAVGREMAAGVPASQIYIDKNSSLKNAMNPMGLMVANRRDEPAGGFQGINRARKEGANPMTYGAAGGFVPNYVAADTNASSGGVSKVLVGLFAFQTAVSVLTGFLEEAGDGGKKVAETLQKVAATALIFGGIAFSGPIKRLKEFADELAKARKAARDSSTDGFSKGYRSGKVGNPTFNLNTTGKLGGVVGRGIAGVKETASDIGEGVAGVARRAAASPIGRGAVAIGRGVGTVGRGVGAVAGTVGRGVGAAGVALGGLLGPATLAIGAFKILGEGASGFRTYSNAAAKSLGEMSVYASKATQSLSELDKAAIESQSNKSYGYSFSSIGGAIQNITGASAVASAITGQKITNTNFEGRNLELSGVSEEGFKQTRQNFISSYVAANRTKFKTAEDAAGKASQEFSSLVGESFTEYDKQALTEQVKELSKEAQKMQKENAIAEALKEAAIEAEIAERDMGNLTAVLGDSAKRIKELKQTIFDLQSSTDAFKSVSEAAIDNAYNLSEYDKTIQKLGVTLGSLDASSAVKQLDLVAKTQENVFNVVKENLKGQGETLQTSGLGSVFQEIRDKISSGKEIKIGDREGEFKQIDLLRLFGQDYRKNLEDLSKEFNSQTAELKNQAKEAQNNANIEAYRSLLTQQTTAALESQTKQFDLQRSSLEKVFDYIEKIRNSTDKISDLNFERGLIGATQTQRLSAQIGRTPELQRRAREASLSSFKQDRVGSVQSLESLIPSTLSSELQFSLKNDILKATKSVRAENTLEGVSKTAVVEYNKTIKKINEAVQKESTERQGYINKIQDALVGSSVTFESSVISAANKFKEITASAATIPLQNSKKDLEAQRAKIPRPQALTPDEKRKLDELNLSIKEFETKNPGRLSLVRDLPENSDLLKKDREITQAEEAVKKLDDAIVELERRIKEFFPAPFPAPIKSGANPNPYFVQPPTVGSKAFPKALTGTPEITSGGNPNPYFLQPPTVGSKALTGAPATTSLPTADTNETAKALESARLAETEALLEVRNSSANAADELEKLRSVSRMLGDEFTQLQEGIPAAIAAIISERNKSISGAEILGANYDLETQRQLARASSTEESDKITRDRQNKSLGQLFAEEYGKTPEEQALDLKNTIVDGSVQFKNNMIEAIMGAAEGTTSLKDGLRSAAYEFVKTINQKMMNNLIDKIVGGSVQSGAGGGGGLAQGIGSFFSSMFASGGMVNGGSGSKDDVPAMLMGGEYVVNKKAVSKYGAQFLESVNNGTLTGYAKGGSVQRGPQGNFYTPGTFGQGAIEGKRNLLDFATQTGTTGQFDKIVNQSGYQAIDLEPESSRLSVSGMRNSPQFEATQAAKQQAFDLYLQQYNAELEAKKAEKEQKKAFRKQLMMLAISAVAGPVLGAAGAGFGAAFKGAAGQGLMSQLGAGAKGIFTGSNGVGGLGNLFSSVGKAFTGDFAGASQQFKYSQGIIPKAIPVSEIGSGIAKQFVGAGQLPKGAGSFRATAYGLASIDKTTAMDQQKADAGNPLYKGFSQTVGASGRKLIPDYSVASNYYPLGTILNINGKEYRVDDRGGMSKDIVDFYAGGDKKLYNQFANMGSISPSIVKKATGGMIPSTSGIDTVPAMLSGGEFVMNRSAVQGIGSQNLQSMNSGGTSIASEETSKKLNEQLLAKLDELISASGSTGDITINVAPSGQSSQENSQDPSSGRQQLARQIKDAVLQIINDEKRIGGSLRR